MTNEEYQSDFSARFMLLFEERARKAYFKRFGKDAAQPSTGLTETDSTHIRLCNVNGVLAVYRAFQRKDGKFGLRLQAGSGPDLKPLRDYLLHEYQQ
jgi:hypothetical protein